MTPANSKIAAAIHVAASGSIYRPQQALVDFYENDPSISIENLENQFDESYQDKFNNFKEFAVEYFNQNLEAPRHLLDYIDYDSFAQDLKHEGFWISDNGYVFQAL